MTPLEAVHKRRPHSGGLSSGDIFGQGGLHMGHRGSSDGISTLFGAKNFGFFEVLGVSVRTSGIEPVWTFC